MATRNIDTSIRYALSITENGLKAAVGLTTDLGKQSRIAQAAVDSSQKAIQAQYRTLESIAVKADQSVAKSAIDSSTIVNKALDAQIAKLRDTGASYTAIMAQQRAMGASAAELAASIKRSSASEIASMQAVRAEADRTVRQRLSLAASGIGGRVGAGAAGLASGVGGAAIGALGITGGLAYAGLEKSRGVIEGTLALHGATGLSQQQSLALSTIATSLGISPRTLGTAFATLGGQTTKALAGSASAGANFSALGISRATVAQNVDNPLALFDLVTSRAKALPATQQAAVQRTLLGRGSTVVGQLTAGGPLAASVAEVSKDIPGLDPKKLIVMQEAFVHLKEVTTAFELSFAQAFGPVIGKGLQAIIPLLKPIATGFQDAFGVIKGVVNGPVGQGLAKFGEMAFASGKKLIEAFKPAMPFFQNVLLPLIKGIAIGIGIGLIGAINLVTAGVKILAPVFGALGTVLAPLKTVIQDVGTVLGIVFSGDALGAVFKGISAVAGEVPLLGKAFEFLLEPINVAGKAIGGIYDVISGTFSKIFGFIPGVGAKLASLLGNVASSIVGAFAAVPDAVVSVFSTIGNAIGNVLATAINAVIDAINSTTSGINSITGLVGVPAIPAIGHLTVGSSAPLVNVTSSGGAAHGGTFRNGGLAFAGGGLVPAMVSPGEQVIYGNMSATVPGSRTAADSVFAMLPHGAAVITGSGQAMMGMGASLGDALAMQAPHFAAGGTVNALGWNVAAPKGSGGGRGSKATMHYVNHLPVGLMTTAQWQAYEAAHPKVSTVGQGLTFSGPASTFGPPGEPAGSTAYGASSSQPGLALNPHGGGNWNDALARSLAGKSFRIEGAGHSAVLKVIDKGPSAIGSHGPRLIDITGAGVTAMGLNPSAFPTDSIFKATEVVGGVASAITKLTAAGTSPTAPTLSNLLPSLTGQTAFAGGYQAGLSGNTLTDTLRSGVLSSLIGDVAVTKGGLVGGTQPTGTSSLSGAGAFTGRLGAMVAKAGEIAGHNYPYLWGGGHNSSFSPPYDCSGAVSSVLHAGGALKSPLVSGDLMHWGQPGKGKSVSIFSSPTHTFMQLAGRYFGTSGGNPGGGANWIPTFPENMPATTHPPGMATGGIVGKGISFRPKITKRVNPLTAPLGLVGSLLGRDDSFDVAPIMAAIAAQLDNIHAETFQSLISLASNLAKHSTKGLDPIQQRRLSTALNLVDAAIGNRIGLAVAGAQNAVDAIARGNAHKAAMATLAGVDPSSTGGLALTVALDKATVGGLNAQIGVLNQALATAKKYGDKATIKDVTDKLNAALGNLDTALVTSMNDWRAAVERAAQDAVDASSQSLSLAQGGQQILSLQQQLAGTDQTPGGGQQMAAYITSTIIPALQKQFQAQQADQAAAASVNDTAKVNADILAEQQSQTAILQAQLDAQNAIKQTSAASANALKQAGGQLASNFNGENGITDRLAGVGVGT